ncbi:MAG: hypothetical protein RLZZ584_4632 [Pseudomonadota bacterium]|jgi:hypothetical protein
MNAATGITRQVGPGLSVIDLASNACAVCGDALGADEAFSLIHRKPIADPLGRYVRIRVHATCVHLAVAGSQHLENTLAGLLQKHDDQTAGILPFLVQA